MDPIRPLLPEAITHHGHRRSIGPIIQIGEQAPGRWPYSEHREIIAGDELAWLALCPFRGTRASHTKQWLGSGERRQLRKTFGAVAKVFVQVVGNQRKLFILTVPTLVAATRFSPETV